MFLKVIQLIMTKQLMSSKKRTLLLAMFSILCINNCTVALQQSQTTTSNGPNDMMNPAIDQSGLKHRGFDVAKQIVSAQEALNSIESRSTDDEPDRKIGLSSRARLFSAGEPEMRKKEDDDDDHDDGGDDDDGGNQDDNKQQQYAELDKLERPTEAQLGDSGKLHEEGPSKLELPRLLKAWGFGGGGFIG